MGLNHEGAKKQATCFKGTSDLPTEIWRTSDDLTYRN